jgi:hypothetical protein
MFRLLLLLLFLASPARALDFFGYVGVMCDLDDPFDDTGLTDFSAEVAGFTNANHVCLPTETSQWVARLRAADAQFRPILSIETAFDFAGTGEPGLWPEVRDAIIDSEIDPARIIFHLVDEPTLRGIAPALVSRAAQIVRADFPTAEVMVIEACRIEGPPLVVPEITLWGFDCYTFADPLTDPTYMTFLHLAQGQLGPGQRLVLIMDANHTPVHEGAGLSQIDMAGVAWAYGWLALSLPDLAGMIGYTWAGGIDGPDERGVRDMPPGVIFSHRQVGLMLLGVQ